ncbi:MAG: mechanosensitive ion channel domain-containing protein [Sulfurimonas sp.]|jgi:miniconductance mechanosensitive channel|nr:mechanosensitive ion channel [Sulfurimonadaceae bacterium]
MQKHLVSLLESFAIVPNSLSLNIATLIIIALFAIFLHIFLHKIILKNIKTYNKKHPNIVTSSMLEFNLFQRLALVVQGIIINIQIDIWSSSDSFLHSTFKSFVDIWILIFGLLALYSIIDRIFKTLHNKTGASFFALNGFTQSIKLLLALITIIYAVSILINKSPIAILSGLGAMSAVLMLVFKDAILGFTAGLQISSTNIVKMGDWITMPKHGADGDVIDIGLTTVRVRNFDKTIVSIPTYALVSDSFKNWRGMQESGGRRIKRSIFIDINSIRFLDDEDKKRLSKAKLLGEYIEQKTKEIDESNALSGGASVIDSRKLTNIGTFRVHILSYLKNHKSIRDDMTIMVRQLDSSQFGMPLELYCFTNTTNWVEYENIQSEIFDYAFSRLKEFGLRVYQYGGA